jgi:hypothetical protein
MEGDYASSSFPSKVLTYMGLGLSVVSCGIDVVIKSKIKDFIQYYHTDSPIAIAQAVLNVGTFDVEKSKSIISQLNIEFIVEIKSFLNT